MEQKRGRFVVVDGLDGVGKGVFLNTFAEEAKKNGKRVFFVEEFWKKKGFHPDLKDIIGKYDVVVTAEPTFVGIGKYIREELTARNGREYSPQVVAGAYALDRQILYEKLILPLLQAEIDVYQSRSFSTSLIFQRQSALELGQVFTVEEILSIPGNNFCFQQKIDYLIIPTIENVAEVIKRSSQREKQDNCKFENLEFQLKLKLHYESAAFREIFEQKGTTVIYFDAGKTIEHSQEQARNFYWKFLY